MARTNLRRNHRGAGGPHSCSLAQSGI